MAIPIPPTPALSRFLTCLAPVAGVVLGLGLPTPALFAQTTTVPINVTVPAPQPATTAARIRWLRDEIARHDELYFKKNAPEISDAAYDALKRELQRLEPTLDAPSKASAIGDDRSGTFPTSGHRQPMLSLAKTYTEAELRAFIARTEQRAGGNPQRWVVEPKFDGLAISVTYEHGQLARAVTRGDGQQGDDVTANVRTIQGLVDTLPTGCPQQVELRGEVFIDYAEFARINTERDEAGLAPFSHPRTLAAGTLKLRDPLEVAKRRLRIAFFGLGAWDGPRPQPPTQQALHAQIREWKLPGVESVKIAQNPDEVWAAVTQLGRHRAALGFPTDGAVVKLDDVGLRQELGASAEAPYWTIAYKFPPERVSTRLIGITLQVGRTGIVTPVAELEPVVIAGTTIERASLYNADAIARRDLRVGDSVFVEKAGEIIPVVVGPVLSRRTPTATPFAFPSICPDCAGGLVRNEGEATTRCLQWACPGQLRRRVEHYVSPEAAGIKGMGPVLIAALVDSQRVQTVADLYRLRSNDLVNIGGVSELVARQLLEQIEQSKKVRLPRLIYGLSIPGVGRSAANEVAAGFTNLPQWAGANSSENGNAPKGSSAAIQEYLSQTENRRLIADLLAHGVCPKTVDRSESSGPLSGKSVVLTGTLLGWTRAEAKRHIEAAGGHITDAVNRRTDLVVAGENPGAKLTAARTLSIEIITESELRKRLFE